MKKFPLLALASEGFSARLLLFGVTVDAFGVYASYHYVRLPIEEGEILTACNRIDGGEDTFTQYVLDPNGLSVRAPALEAGHVVFKPLSLVRLGG